METVCGLIGIWCNVVATMPPDNLDKIPDPRPVGPVDYSDDLCNGRNCYVVATGKNHFELIDCPSELAGKLPHGANVVCVKVSPEYW